MENLLKLMEKMENLQKNFKRQKEYTIQLNKESDKLNQRIEDLKKELEVKERQLEVKNEIIESLLDSYRNSIRFK